MIRETHIENALISKLENLKYVYRTDIRDRDSSLEKNFREKHTFIREDNTPLNLLYQMKKKSEN